MNGIFGAWRLDGQPLNVPDLGRCLARLAPHPHDKTWTEGPAFLAAGSDQLLTFRDHVAVFDGRLDGRSTLLHAIGDHPLARADAPDVNLVLAAYDRFGMEAIERIDGDFALAIFDGPSRRLVLGRDRVGMRPLCHTQVGATMLFSSDAKALLAFPGMTANPDEAMFADFVLYFLAADDQSRTFFKNIHSLPPAHLLVATREGVTVRPYFDFDATRTTRLGGLRDYAAAFDQLLVSSVRNRLRSRHPVAMSVSGGLDSSYIFCAAQRAWREEPGLCPAIIGFNYGGPEGAASDERAFVEALERHCGVRIQRVPPRAGFMADAADEVWHTESPNLEILGRLTHTTLDSVRRAGAHRLLTGHWGDQVLSDSDYLIDLLQAGRWSTLWKHCTGWNVSPRRLAMRAARDLVDRHATRRLTPWLRQVWRREPAAWERPWYTPRFRRLLRERFLAERPPRPAGSSHARAIYRQARVRYHLQCMEWNVRAGRMHDVDVAFPYLDHHLIQFLMSIPGDMQSHDGVPRGLMREAMKGTVPTPIIDRRSKGEFTYLCNEGVDQEFAQIRALLGPGSLSVQFGYVDGPELWRRLDEWRAAIHRADDAVVSDRIVDLCGFELLLRGFFTDEHDGSRAHAQMRTA